MNKKIVMIMLAVAAISLTIPVAVAYTWDISYNSGDEPFTASDLEKNTGTQTTTLTDVINITNDGSLINGMAGLTGDAILDIIAENLTTNGTVMLDGAMVAAIWVNFYDHAIASHRGWCNITALTAEPTGNSGCLRTDYSASIGFTDIRFDSLGKWVYTENGHTAGDNPTWGYALDTDETMGIKVIYSVNTNSCDVGSYYDPSGHGVTVNLVKWE